MPCRAVPIPTVPPASYRGRGRRSPRAACDSFGGTSWATGDRGLVEDGGKIGPEGAIDRLHARMDSKRGERGDAMLADAAGHDAAVVSEIGRDVERDAVVGHAVPHPDADGGDLVLAPAVACDPDADSPVAAFARDAEIGERADDPFLEGPDEGAQIAAAAVEVEQHIGDALAGPVIGPLPTAAGTVHGQQGGDEIAVA